MNGANSCGEYNKNLAVSPDLAKASTDMSTPLKKSPTFISLHLPIKKEEITCEEAKLQVDADLFENESVDSEAEDEESDSEWEAANEARRKEEARPSSKAASSTSQVVLKQNKVPLITKSKSAKLSKPEIRSSPINNA